MVETQMVDEDIVMKKGVQRTKVAVSLDNKFSDLPDTATATTSSTNTETPTAPTISTLNRHESDLRSAIAKHQDNILRLFRSETGPGRDTIPKKMLCKIRTVNTTSMAKANVLIARTGSKKLSAKKLKKLGSNAELKAKQLHDAEMAEKNGPTDDISAVDPNAKLAEAHDGDLAKNATYQDFQETEDKGHEQDPDGFWRMAIPDGLQILTMTNDGDCFFRSISDQLTHDQGAGHKFVRYQITNHIQHNEDKFKNILLAGDDDEELMDLESYLYKMVQNGEWGGPPKVYAAAWFYGVDIMIYSKEYSNTGRCLTFTADGPKGSNVTSRSTWHISYHDNNHYNSVRSLDPVPRNSQNKSDNDRLEADLQRVLDGHYHDCNHLACEADEAGSLVLPDDINTI
jgi:hypothetical protein